MNSEERWIQNEIERIKRKKKRVLNNLEELEKEHVTERVTSILKDRIASYDHEIKLYKLRLSEMVKIVYPLQKDGPVDFMCPACQYGSVLNIIWTASRVLQLLWSETEMVRRYP